MAEAVKTNLSNKLIITQPVTVYSIRKKIGEPDLTRNCKKLQYGV